MANEINYMDLREFREEGYLQEVNRMFFHPLGLALEMIFHENGKVEFGGVWDYREDPEGVAFGPGMIDAEKATFVERQAKLRGAVRERLFGAMIQPVCPMEIGEPSTKETQS